MTWRLARDWDDLARTDPMFAILSEESKDDGRWDLDEFFETGRRDFAATMAKADLWSLPLSFEMALDFGSGIGRVTRAMTTRFEHCVGVDVSAAMVSEAQKLDTDAGRCEFVHRAEPDLRLFDDCAFDFVYCNVVLQHLGRRRLAESFIQEFCRVLRPGGLLVFQVPHRLPLRSRLQLKRRLYRLLRTLRARSEFLAAAGLYPIGMISVPERRAEACLAAAGPDIVQLDVDRVDAPGYPSATHWVTRLAEVL